MIKRILTEPLLHFLLIGLVLLFAYEAIQEDLPEDNKIIVNQNRIFQLNSIFAKKWQRPPTRQELEGLVNDYVLEEIYYREALRLGLDRDDTVIRRRLRQKMEFLSSDMVSIQDATEQQLTRFMQENPEKFRRQPEYSFSQVYFNPDKHSDIDVDSLARERLSNTGNATPVGDSSMLPANLANVTPKFIDSRFGQGFAQQLDGLNIGEWDGPVESGFGVHLVKVDKISPALMPQLDEIRTQVYNEWKHDQLQNLTRKMNERLLNNYQVTIEWEQPVQSG